MQTYEPAEEIILRDESEKSRLTYHNRIFPDLCFCFETTNILKIAYQDSERIVFKTHFLGRHIISVEVSRKDLDDIEAGALPLSLRSFSRRKSE